MTPATAKSTSPDSTKELPQEFAAPQLRELLAEGKDRGFLMLAQVREALESSGLPKKGQTTVLRTFSDHAIEVREDATSALPATKRAAKKASAAAKKPVSKPKDAVVEETITETATEVSAGSDQSADKPAAKSPAKKAPAKKAAPRKRVAKKAAPAKAKDAAPSGSE
ncbi:MAG: RNA polymerase sigma factor region1.1 domain-containing protein, partial [Ornithinimicrobium sp.]